MKYLAIKYFKLFSLLVFLLHFSYLAECQNINTIQKVKELILEYKYSEAYAFLQSLPENESQTADFLYLKSKILLELRNYSETTNILLQLYVSDSTNTKVINDLVNIYRLTNEKDKAIVYAKKLQKLNPENQYFVFQLTDLLIQNEEFNSAIDLLSDIFKSDSSNVYALMQLANCYYQLQNYNIADSIYKKVLMISPFEKNAISRRANISILTKNYDDGINITNEYLRFDSLNTSILKLNAYLYYLKENYYNAIEQFEKCIKLNETSRFVKKYLAMSHYKIMNYEVSMQLFSELWKIDSSEVEICYYLGVSANRSEQADSGIYYLNRTIEHLVPPESFLSSVYSELADAYNNVDKNDIALQCYEKALEIYPENNTLLFRIAYQYDFYLDKPKIAFNFYKKFLIKAEKSQSSYENNKMSISYYDYANNRVKELENYNNKKK